MHTTGVWSQIFERREWRHNNRDRISITFWSNLCFWKCFKIHFRDESRLPRFFVNIMDVMVDTVGLIRLFQWPVMSLMTFSASLGYVCVYVCVWERERNDKSVNVYVCVWLVSLCPQSPSAMDFKAAVTGLTSDLWMFYSQGTSQGTAFASADWYFFLLNCSTDV